MLKLTRHAKNNMRLYKITEKDIKIVLEQPETKFTEKDKYIAIKKIENKFEDMPLKVVYKVEKGIKIIITAYPVKKIYKRRHEWK